jgi:thiol-disulfide isomerase/thioredoxin
MAAPAFSVTSLEGKQYDLASLRGKTVVLNFWFLGCPPCVAEVPELNKLVAEFKDKNVVFLALALDDEKRCAPSSKKRSSNTKSSRMLQTLLWASMKSVFSPHIILDAEGNIVSELIGNKQLDNLRAELRRAVAGQATKTGAP